MSSDKFIMPLFYKRFTSSTQDWTDEEVGAYIRLLIHQWDNGNIPNETQRLTRIANSAEKNWAILSNKFPNGINPTLEEIRKERKEFIEKQILNGRKGGRPSNPKITQTKPINKPKNNPNKTLSSGSSSSISNCILNKELEKIFEEWKLYRIKIKKPIHEASMDAAQKKLLKLSGGNEIIAKEIIEQSIAAGWQGLFPIKTDKPKGAAAWLI